MATAPAFLAQMAGSSSPALPLVAAMRSPRGASAAIVRAAWQSRVTWLISVPLAIECEAVCRRSEHRVDAGQGRSTKRFNREPIAVQKDWQLQDAKARFSEVFRLARENGPQRVTKHGRTAVVVLTAEEYERLSRAKTHPGSLVRFFADSPLAGSGIQLDRKRDLGRAIDL